jgi:hypothetical protein
MLLNLHLAAQSSQQAAVYPSPAQGGHLAIDQQQNPATHCLTTLLPGSTDGGILAELLGGSGHITLPGFDLIKQSIKLLAGLVEEVHQNGTAAVLSSLLAQAKPPGGAQAGAAAGAGAGAAAGRGWPARDH